MAKWITNIGKNSLMLTISEPHAKTHNLDLSLTNLEPIVSDIIKLANSFVFGKHKRFIFLKGIIVCENLKKEIPHFHVVFMKPENIDFDIFKSKLEKIAHKLCKEEFVFDLKHTYLCSKKKYLLSQPCYEKFVKVSNSHENIGRYLTKSWDASYFILNDRAVNFEKDKIDLFVCH